jgi:hypothetical protein
MLSWAYRIKVNYSLYIVYNIPWTHCGHNASFKSVYYNKATGLCKWISRELYYF